MISSTALMANSTPTIPPRTVVSIVIKNGTGQLTSLEPTSKRLCKREPKTRYELKVRPLVECSPSLNWDSARVVTPGGLCGYKSDRSVKYVSFNREGSVEIFSSGENSQGLASQYGTVVAASVTTEIQTETARKNEKKQTLVQYDKRRVLHDEVDFSVNPENYRGHVNYQGGHLIDHKYSAGGSHDREENYIPMHYFYNSPLKEFLVQRCDEYVEIPLYTQNPPLIGVKGKSKEYHKIPIGIIFVQIKNKKIQDVYYFPNNKFDFEILKKKFNLKKGEYAEKIAPLFKLNKSFHPLFRAAIIMDIHQQNGESKQLKKEKKFLGIMDQVIEGVTLEESKKVVSAVGQLCCRVFASEDIDPKLCLSCSEEQYKLLEDQPLALPFQYLEHFLVDNVIKNALKSEVLSISSRLLFLNGIITSIELHGLGSESKLDFFEYFLLEEYENTFFELDQLEYTMNEMELMDLANLYQRLATPLVHHFYVMDRKIFDGEIESYFSDGVKVLKNLSERFPIHSFKKDLLEKFIGCCWIAQENLDYLMEVEYPEGYHSDGEDILLDERRFFIDIGQLLSQLIGDSSLENLGKSHLHDWIYSELYLLEGEDSKHIRQHIRPRAKLPIVVISK